MRLPAAVEDHPLKVSPDFRALFSGNAMVALAQRCFVLTMGWWVVTLAGAGGTSVGTFMAVYGGAVFLGSALVGPLVDRSDLRRSMMASALIQGGFVTWIGLALERGTLGLPLLCALGAGVGLAVPLFESSVVSALPRTVEERHLEAATAVQSSTVELANIFAAALGSSLIAFFGVGPTVGLVAALYGLGVVFLLRVRANQAPAPRVEAPSPEPGPAAQPHRGVVAQAARAYFAEWLDGVRGLVADGPLWRLFLLVAVYGVLVLPIFLLVPVLVNEVLRLPVGWVAAFEVSLSVGAVATTGALSLKREELPLDRVFPLLMAGTGVGLALAGWIRWPYGLVAVFALVGSCYAGFLTLTFVAFQRRVPPERKGRLFALLATVSTGLAPLGFLLAGAAADAFSPGTVLLAAGAGMGGLAVASAFRRG